MGISKESGVEALNSSAMSPENVVQEPSNANGWHEGHTTGEHDGSEPSQAHEQGDANMKHRSSKEQPGTEMAVPNQKEEGDFKSQGEVG